MRIAPKPKDRYAPRLGALSLPRRSTLRFFATVLLLTLAVTSRASDAPQAHSSKHEARRQLSIGYSLLYQEADGIAKLKWILMFKDEPDAEMKAITNDLLGYYRQLADTMQKLSKQYPAMRIDVAPLPEIVADSRKAMGEDLAKEMAPLVGQSGVKFEREALLTFRELLNEQRHLAGVMLPRETNPGLKKFLQTTQAQFEEYYAKVGALLDRRYFTR